MADDGLCVRDLLKETYNRLAEGNKHRLITLPEAVRTEIADDSDIHRNRTGYMRYTELTLYDFNYRSWAVGMGKARGDYPARSYDSDILALNVPRESSVDYLMKALKDSTYFKNTLILGLADGCLSTVKSCDLSQKVREALQTNMSEFILQKAECNETVLMLDTLDHPTTKEYRYKPELAECIAKIIKDVLEIS